MKSSQDAFPSTDRSRLAGMLAAGPAARADAVRLVLERYLDPLRIYVRGSSLRSIGDDVDLVQGFFAARLARHDYLDGWIASGLQLRRWLINGLHLYAKEERRRNRAAGEESVNEPSVTRVPAAEAAWAREVLVQACEIAEAELRTSGRLQAWDIFRRHFVDGRSYRDLQHEFGLRPSALAEASRRVSILLREAVRLLLVRDGVAPDEVDAELASMLKAIEERHP
jgi:hypothetical protein